MTVFDPWNGSLDDAIRVSEEMRTEGRPSGPCNPVFQWQAARDIGASREIIDAGDGFAVLVCIRKCVTHGLVAPDWLASAFNQRYDSVLNCRVASWDDPSAFGRPHPKGAHVTALRKKRTLKLAVLNAVNDLKLRDPDRAIGPELFEKIGKQFGIGKTLTEEYYYSARRALPNSEP